MTKSQFGIIGAGAWGTAIGTILARNGQDVLLWSRQDEVVESINQTRENALFLPNIKLGPSIKATCNFTDVLEREILVLAVPAQATREIACRIREKTSKPRPILLTAKGVEQNTCYLMSEIIEDILSGFPIAVLSGPNFAQEVAQNLPTAATLATQDGLLGKRLLASLATYYFRPYLSSDVVGAQIGGAVKNVLAIACGILVGQGLGENARAALLSRGLAEMVRLGTAKGGRIETFMGLAGMGDLTLTCMSLNSRNTSFGVSLGQQNRLLKDDEAVHYPLVEGCYTAASLVKLAREVGVEMPICEGVNLIVNGGGEIDKVIHSLLARPSPIEEFPSAHLSSSS